MKKEKKISHLVLWSSDSYTKEVQAETYYVKEIQVRDIIKELCNKLRIC